MFGFDMVQKIAIDLGHAVTRICIIFCMKAESQMLNWKAAFLKAGCTEVGSSLSKTSLFLPKSKYSP